MQCTMHSTLHNGAIDIPVHSSCSTKHSDAFDLGQIRLTRQARHADQPISKFCVTALKQKSLLPAICSTEVAVHTHSSCIVGRLLHSITLISAVLLNAGSQQGRSCLDPRVVPYPKYVPQKVQDLAKPAAYATLETPRSSDLDCT